MSRVDIDQNAIPENSGSSRKKLEKGYFNQNV